MEKITIRARHFFDANFASHDRCPLAKALRSRFGEVEISAGVYNSEVAGMRIHHSEYTCAQFIQDRTTASTLNPDAVVRTLIVTKIETLNK